MSKSVRFHLRSTIWINALLSCWTCLQSCIRMQRRKSMKIIIVRAQVNKIEIKSRSLMTVCLSYTHLTKITSLCETFVVHCLLTLHLVKTAQK